MAMKNQITNNFLTFQEVTVFYGAHSANLDRREP